MEFTDQELMLIEQITYFDKNVADAAGVELKTLDEYSTIGKLFNEDDFNEDAINNLINYGTVYDSEGYTTYMQGNEWAAIIKEIQDNKDISSLEPYGGIE